MTTFSSLKSFLVFTVRDARRWLLIVSGCVFIGLSVCLLLASNLGADPVSVLLAGVASWLSVPIWLANLTVAGCLLAVAFLLGHKLTAVNVVNPLVISVTVAVVLPLTPSFGSAVSQVAAASAGILFLGFGVALYLFYGPGSSHADAVPVMLSKRFGSLRAWMSIQYALFVLIGWLCGESLGWFTLLAALLTGPVAALVLAGLARWFPRSELSSSGVSTLPPV